MNIERDIEREREVYDKVKAWLTRFPRVELHVSDLQYPRKAYFQRIDPKPLSDEQAGYFIAGHGHHYMIEAIIDPEKGRKKKGDKEKGSDSGTYDFDGLKYSPDIRLPTVTEFKTSRAQYGPKNDEKATLLKEYKQYLKQLLMYMAIEDEGIGHIVILYLRLKNKKLNKSVPTFRVYKVTATDQEREVIRDKIRAAKALLEKALESKDHKALSLCPSFMCLDCPWKKQCDPKNTAPKKEIA
jgi:hypothetical protein